MIRSFVKGFYVAKITDSLCLGSYKGEPNFDGYEPEYALLRLCFRPAMYLSPNRDDNKIVNPGGQERSILIDQAVICQHIP